MIIRENYLHKILPFMGKPVVKVISGMRRVGKSTFLAMLRERLLESGQDPETVIWINKESLEFEAIADFRDLNAHVLERLGRLPGNATLFIDEIQEIAGWEKAVASLLAEGRTDLVITGSNAGLLSSELATLLTGRYVTVTMYPLGFREFLDFRDKSAHVPDRDREFTLYLKYGGLPGVHFLEMRDEVVFQYLDSILSSVLLKDVVSRYAVRDVSSLERIARFVFDNVGSITTAKRVSDFLKSQKVGLSVDTVQNYLFYLRQAFLVHKAERFDLKGRRRLEFSEKYYMGDVGLRHAFLGYRDQDVAGLLENIVYLELLRRGYRVTVGKLADMEVDFVAEKEGSRMYVQVCYLLASPETSRREFGPLERIQDNYPKMVLSMDSIGPQDHQGIVRRNLIEFLLEET